MRKIKPALARIPLAGCSPACSLFGIRSRAQDPELAFEQVVGHPRGFPQLPPQGPGAK